MPAFAFVKQGNHATIVASAQCLKFVLGLAGFIMGLMHTMDMIDFVSQRFQNFDAKGFSLETTLGAGMWLLILAVLLDFCITIVAFAWANAMVIHRSWGGYNGAGIKDKYIGTWCNGNSNQATQPGSGPYMQPYPPQGAPACPSMGPDMDHQAPASGPNNLFFQVDDCPVGHHGELKMPDAPPSTNFLSSGGTLGSGGVVTFGAPCTPTKWNPSERMGMYNNDTNIAEYAKPTVPVMGGMPALPTKAMEKE